MIAPESPSPSPTPSPDSSSSTLVASGRGIRRLVSLSDRVEDLVNEADRRTCLDESVHEHTKDLPCSGLSTLKFPISLPTPTERGADCAQGDDCASLKPAIVQWLMLVRPAPEPPLDPFEKTGRGFNHDITGCLLCPVDYDWRDAEHCSAIRDFHPDFLVTEHNWPTFLYENEQYDPENCTKGLFKNKLLVQVHFALSSCSSWRIVDGEFNYQNFYHNITYFFEGAKASEEKQFVEGLLLWWNRKVFGRTHMSDYRPQNVNKMSVAMSLPKRCHGHSVTRNMTPPPDSHE
ncbi:hypothetical protein BDN67DRAFT_986045 [Paxillus ammoniavirescens]|nr:hypothetical protein BDN67DRAFT_986045 [Paxillus ammoniavirescens]